MSLQENSVRHTVKIHSEGQICFGFALVERCLWASCFTCGWLCGCCCVPFPDISPGVGQSVRQQCFGCSWDTRTPCFSTGCTPGQTHPIPAGPQFLEMQSRPLTALCNSYMKCIAAMSLALLLLSRELIPNKGYLYSRGHFCCQVVCGEIVEQLHEFEKI